MSNFEAGSVFVPGMEDDKKQKGEKMVEEQRRNILKEYLKSGQIKQFYLDIEKYRYSVEDLARLPEFRDAAKTGLRDLFLRGECKYFTYAEYRNLFYFTREEIEDLMKQAALLIKMDGNVKSESDWWSRKLAESMIKLSSGNEKKGEKCFESFFNDPEIPELIRRQVREAYDQYKEAKYADWNTFQVYELPARKSETK